jgi:hypothetical protein
VEIQSLRPDTLDRMVRAVEAVRQRLLRATAALESAQVPYAVVGGHAVAGWVSQVDEGAVRNTRDVDILVRRADFPAVRSALEVAGFVYTKLIDVDVFLDGPEGQPSQGVHLLYAAETVRPDYTVPNPDVTESVPSTNFRMVNLEALVRMKLVSNRLKDRVHLQDMIRVGLIDHTWPDRFPTDLADRLRDALANPDG